MSGERGLRIWDDTADPPLHGGLGMEERVSTQSKAEPRVWQGVFNTMTQSGYNRRRSSA